MPETILRCVVRAPNRRTVTVFVIPPCAPAEVDAVLKKASARIPGTTVLPAGLAKHAEVGDDGNKYLFGTGGVLRFLEPQSYEQLEAIVRLVADTFIADRFDVVEPLEVVREPGN